jgi:hypothetical protein
MKPHFSEGAWGVGGEVYSGGSNNPWSKIIHKCGWRGFRHRMTLPVEMYTGAHKMECRHCREPIPEGIAGLWILHNWDRLEQHRKYISNRNAGEVLWGVAHHGTSSGGAK